MQSGLPADEDASSPSAVFDDDPVSVFILSDDEPQIGSLAWKLRFEVDIRRTTHSSVRSDAIRDVDREDNLHCFGVKDRYRRRLEGVRTA